MGIARGKSARVTIRAPAAAASAIDEICGGRVVDELAMAGSLFVAHLEGRGGD
jgi:hypothetical protein